LSDNRNLIVSLTSFPGRIEKVWLAIESIMDQSLKPDQIILWLAKEEFDGKKSLPKNLTRLEKRGLEIRFCEDNLMPHKKYFYAMQQYPESIVITIDDDMIYSPFLVEKLVENNKKYPKAICCSILREIEFDDQNNPLPYREWSYVRENKKPDFKYHVMGGGGTLFPPKSIHDEAFNVKNLKKMALRTDDLWLKIMSLKNGAKVMSIAGEFDRFFVPLIFKEMNRLADDNISQNINDRNLQALYRHYGINFVKSNFSKN
jgi:hypothetical protein